MPPPSALLYASDLFEGLPLADALSLTAVESSGDDPSQDEAVDEGLPAEEISLFLSTAEGLPGTENHEENLLVTDQGRPAAGYVSVTEMMVATLTAPHSPPSGQGILEITSNSETDGSDGEVYAGSALVCEPLELIPLAAAPMAAGTEVIEGELTADDPDNPLSTGKYYDDYLLSDYVSFQAGQPITIDLVANFDAYLYLVNGDTGASIKSDDDSGEGLNSRIIFTAEQGVNYVARATSLGTGVTGAYTLTITLQPNFDLSVNSFTVPAEVISGSPVTATLSVANAGPDDATGLNGQWYAGVYASPDQTWDQYGDTYVGEFPIDGLGTVSAGGNASGTVTFAPGSAVPVGSTNFFAVVNPPTATGAMEADRTNNISAAAPATVSPPGADLTVSAATVPTETVDAGAAVDVSWTVTNGGDAAAGITSWWDRVYVSTDNLWDEADPFLISVERRGGLAAGESYTVNQNVTIPYGAWTHLLFRADYTGLQPESSETNNVRAEAISVHFIPPDLTITGASVDSGTTTAGETIQVSWTTANQGDGATYQYWYDKVYLSYDSVLSSDDYSSYYWEKYESGTLDSGGTFDRTMSITLPTNRTGAYLLFVADVNNSLVEGSETNNVAAVAVDMPSPDLEVTAASTDRSVVGGNNLSLTVTYTVRNSGDANTFTTNWYDRFYLSDDQVWDQEDTSMGYQYASYAEGFSAPFGPGASYQVEKSVTIPSTALPGNKYLLVVTGVDYYGNPSGSELNRANNVRAVALTLGEGNLTISGASWTPAPVTTGNLGDSHSYTAPTVPMTFTLAEEATIASITTRHSYNAPQVTLSVYRQDGSTVGAWTAVSEGSYDWTAEVNVTLSAGTYRVGVSDPSTWYRSNDTGKGLARIIYTPARNGHGAHGDGGDGGLDGDQHRFHFLYVLYL